MIRPDEYTDRGVFTDRDGVWRPKVGASVGVVEPVPEPWFDRFLPRWLPHLALQRAQVRAELRRLEQQLAEPPGTVRVQSWNHTAQRWEPAGSLLPSPWVARRRRS
jgi:hypothetical protein